MSTLTGPEKVINENTNGYYRSILYSLSVATVGSFCYLHFVKGPISLLVNSQRWWYWDKTHNDPGMVWITWKGFWGISSDPGITLFFGLFSGYKQTHEAKQAGFEANEKYIAGDSFIMATLWRLDERVAVVLGFATNNLSCLTAHK